jgi:hypothetical protein
LTFFSAGGTFGALPLFCFFFETIFSFERRHFRFARHDARAPTGRMHNADGSGETKRERHILFCSRNFERACRPKRPQRILLRFGTQVNGRVIVLYSAATEENQ